MKVLFIVISLFASLAASADYDCYRKALDDFSVDSKAFQIHDEDAAVMFEDSAERASFKAIRELEAKLKCAEKSFEISEISCKDVVPNNSLSRVCYVESQMGYFFISMDMMEGFNVVFNRWD